MLKRIILLATVAGMIAIMFVVTAGPASARGPCPGSPPASCFAGGEGARGGGQGGHGKIYTTEGTFDFSGGGGQAGEGGFGGYCQGTLSDPESADCKGNITPSEVFFPENFEF